MFDLGGAEAFQRYLSEEATGSPTADVIVNTDGAGWLDLVERGKVVDYIDPELAAYLVDQAVLAPGVFAMSTTVIVAFKMSLLPLDELMTLAEMAAMAPELSGQIGTVNVINANAGLGTSATSTRTARRAGRCSSSSARTRASRTARGVARQAADRRVRRQLLRLGSLRTLIDTHRDR